MKGNSSSGWRLGGGGGGDTAAAASGGGRGPGSNNRTRRSPATASETDPLISSSGGGSGSGSSSSSYVQSRLSNNSEIRERRPSNNRSSSSSNNKMEPSTTTPASSTDSGAGGRGGGRGGSGGPAHVQANNNTTTLPATSSGGGYTRLQTNSNNNGGDDHSTSAGSLSYQHSTGSRSLHSIRRSYVIDSKTGGRSGGGGDSGQAAGLMNDTRNHMPLHQHHQDKQNHQQPPLLEIPEEVYGVRKAALQVMKPLTRTWFIISVGCSLTILFGMARWTRLLPRLPFWFILLPSWISHMALFSCHVKSARALSAFIAEANESRQRPDSRDQLDRTEYLPLLQRSLKFGLKTGLISFGIFLFEILIYFRLARGHPSLLGCLTPIWFMVIAGIVEGILCRTQHFLQVCCWALVFASMVMMCLKVDYGFDSILWMMIISPIVAVLSVASASLIYIVYGHQVGYYRLTESQLTAGNLYSLAALISIVLVVVIAEVIPLARPVEIETRVFVVLMAPLVVVLVGMGAWVVSRDEFGRLLLYGGQAQVHPKRLRLESGGWTSVQGRGVTTIPMFGEVSFQPLEKTPEMKVELCMCCTCYPYDESDEDCNQWQHGTTESYAAPAPV